MPWTAEVISSTKDQFGIADVVVSFTDGSITQSVKFHGVTSDDNLKQLILAQIKAYEDADKVLISVPVGPVDLTPVVVEPPQPTQEELDKRAFLDAYQRAGSLRRGSFLPTVAKLVDAAIADADSKFKPEYVSLL